MRFEFMPVLPTSQGHAEDMVLFHRFNYYVIGVGLISDAEYDQLEGYVRSEWPVGIASLVPGSDCAEDYPLYIREGRRPNWIERAERDSLIAKLYMDHL